MNAYHEVTAELIESTFSETGNASRFANFCNAIILAECSGPTPSLPALSEKPGADGSFDGEWTLDLPAEAAFASPFAEVGWNVFQYKVRGIVGGGRAKASCGLSDTI